MSQGTASTNQILDLSNAQWSSLFRQPLFLHFLDVYKPSSVGKRVSGCIVVKT